jgi:predicted flavoprotein YhiN
MMPRRKYMFNFNNIGKKIKTIAKISFYLLSVSFLFYGILLIIKTDNDILGLLWLILGPIISWISSFVLYGFGQLVDNSDKLIALKEVPNNDIQNNKKAKTTHLENTTISSNTKPNKEIEEINCTSKYKMAKQIINDLPPEHLDSLKQKYKKWAIEIEKMTIEKLFAIIEKEQNEWEEDYIYLCSFEILNRIKIDK